MKVQTYQSIVIVITLLIVTFYPSHARLKKNVRADNIDGGMTGIYNTQLTANINGITSKTENTNINNNVSILNIDPLDKPMD